MAAKQIDAIDEMASALTAFDGVMELLSQLPEHATVSPEKFYRVLEPIAARMGDALLHLQEG